MTGVRESRYRRALLFYPKRWRDRNADVVLSTLHDVADAEGRRSPRASELLQLAASGLSTRLALSLSQSARDALSTIAVATGAVLGLAFAVVQSLPVPGPLAGPKDVGLFFTPGVVIYAVWVLTFVLAFLGQRRAVKVVLMVCVFTPAVLWVMCHLIGQLWARPSLETQVFFTVLAMVALIGTPRPTWRVGIAMAIGAGTLIFAFHLIGVPAKSYMDEGTFWRLIASPYNAGTALALLGVIVLSFVIAGRGAWSKLLLVSFSPWVAAWCVSVVYEFRWNGAAGLIVGLLAGMVSRLLMRAARRSRSECIS